MNHYTQYLHYHVGLLQEFKALMQTSTPFNEEETLQEEDITLMTTLTQLCNADQYTETMNEQGQWLVGRIISAYSHMTPYLPRDLLWFFGGDCLHYMPDEEINFYQQLDELRFAAEDASEEFDFIEAKRNLSNVTAYHQ